MYGWSNYYGTTPKEGIMKRELSEMLSFISGVSIASNFREGQKLVISDGLEERESFFQKIFEIGRRYKVMNPEKMRTTYGKLMFMLMDAMRPGISSMNLLVPISCVYTFLESKGAVALLTDENIGPATRFIVGSSPEDVQLENICKAKAREAIITKYCNGNFTKEEVNRVLESISDSNSYILSNRTPVDKMINFLKKYFKPNEEEKDFSLAIKYGSGGSCLTHSHSTQYTFVNQSLHLWREIQHNMFKLWSKADADMLGSEGKYKLMDTGQGMNRVQSAPKVSHVMSNILDVVRSGVGGWVGLSVVHLGDRDVPNALVFIDKYTQVPRILAPIVSTIERLHEMSSDAAVKIFIDQYGGLDHLCKCILRDFFRHGFDGSGDDGGSCIDGRLTSAWNWCSKIEKKEYYPVFLLTGFYGFDGNFRR
eukprot:TRINITY_DN4941_c0_g3_i2.p1 TRINITY_DN4941_c0_g3~~TRINITY_DN4941_c0_g3_i2.p1  ORF type:complete len:423 (+),score=75.17 TRINITY_DN4941_c0_g3_i2:327-1595(+)